MGKDGAEIFSVPVDEDSAPGYFDIGPPSPLTRALCCTVHAQWPLGAAVAVLVRYKVGQTVQLEAV
jgi:hypothetical protein